MRSESYGYTGIEVYGLRKIDNSWRVLRELVLSFFTNKWRFMYKNYRELGVWKRSMDLAVNIHNSLQNNNDYSFNDQIRRYSLSIPSNIAEWYEKQTRKEVIRWLYIAKWEAWEQQTQLVFWNRIWYFTKDEYDTYMNESCELSKMIHWLIKYEASKSSH